MKMCSKLEDELVLFGITILNETKFGILSDSAVAKANKAADCGRERLKRIFPNPPHKNMGCLLEANIWRKSDELVKNDPIEGQNISHFQPFYEKKADDCRQKEDPQIVFEGDPKESASPKIGSAGSKNEIFGIHIF